MQDAPSAKAKTSKYEVFAPPPPAFGLPERGKAIYPDADFPPADKNPPAAPALSNAVGAASL